ncbi:sulfotransferase [Dictyobacter kobayashii]|uniref:Sulfotransferase n=1 Tax=Dictyobacter kobayashii TaxID=2014872 RepID=A0A402AC94_9CHLR|nr:sulfotransferase [Dictyobacter kobayashii]GCE16717.1 sulfotransferase [Dictyobacter kobayashii]
MGILADQTPNINKQHKHRPNFLVVGAVKSATTSLYYWLKQHPQVFMPIEKEPAYFIHNGYGEWNERYEHWDAYLGLFDDVSDEKAVGESSTDYLYCAESAPWILEEFGQVKIMMVLRNPVDRAYSLYLMMIREGYERLDTFEKALEAEEARYKDPDFKMNNPYFFPDYLYFYSGLYSEQVQRYIDLFGRERVFPILFDDVSKHPERTFQEICQFLEVDPSFVPKFDHLHKKARPYSIPLQYFFRTRLFQDKYSRMLIGSQSRTAIRERLLKWNRTDNVAPMSKDTRTMLTKKYREDILALSQIIGRDLSQWL